MELSKSAFYGSAKRVHKAAQRGIHGKSQSDKRRVAWHTILQAQTLRGREVTNSTY